MSTAAIIGAADTIRVSAVSLGRVDAAVTGRALAELPDANANSAKVSSACILSRLVQPEEVAAAIAFLLSDAVSFVADTDSIFGGDLL